MLKRLLRAIGIILAIFLLVAIVGPLVIPMPPLTDLAPVEELADPDSRFIEVNGISVHYKIYGSGEPVMILMHGFGASLFSWREVVDPLSQLGTVIAYDRPAFGLTERLMRENWAQGNPYTPEANRALLFGMMDALGVQQAILIGNSAGGRLAVQAALERPERVAGLVLVDAAVFTGGRSMDGFTRFLFNTPQMMRLGPIFARSIAGEQGDAFIQTAWHDPSKITPEITEGYRKALRMDNWDRALWEFTLAGSGSEDLSTRLSELSMPVLVVAGDDDRIVPTADSRRLGAEIPGAQLVVFPACGHVPQEECPAEFLKAVQPFVNAIPTP
jgi:pimeloyl-ACP methyl ester carboxylesterase